MECPVCGETTADGDWCASCSGRARPHMTPHQALHLKRDGVVPTYPCEVFMDVYIGTGERTSEGTCLMCGALSCEVCDQVAHRQINWSDERAACEVAADLVEMGRDGEAWRLLEEQAPHRHARYCSKCYSYPGNKCTEDIDQGFRVLLVPHLERLRASPVL